MNPQQPAAPAAPAPAAPAVSDAQAVANMIGGLGAAPEPSLNFESSTDPFSQPPAPAAPAYPQQPPAPQIPAQQPPAPVAPPQPPQYQPQPPAPVAPQYQPAPGIPGAPPQQPQAPQPGQPQVDPNAIPLSIAVPPQQPGAPVAGFTPEQVQQIVETAVRAQQQQPAPVAPGQPQEWTPTSWADVEARIEQRAQELVNKGFTDVQATTQARQQQQQDSQRRANEYIETQVRQLEQTGYLPPIANPADPTDPGRAAHQELFAYAISLGTDNLAAVAPTLYAHHQAGYFYDRSTNRLVRRGSQSAAAQAPIAGATPSAPQSATAGLPTARDFATLSMAELADRANQAYPLTPSA